MKDSDKLAETDELVEALSVHLAGRDPDVVGAALANLVATYIGSHAPGIREQTRDLLIECADKLTPIVIEEMIEQGRAPAYWRGDA